MPAQQPSFPYLRQVTLIQEMCGAYVEGLLFADIPETELRLIQVKPKPLKPKNGLMGSPKSSNPSSLSASKGSLPFM